MSSLPVVTKSSVFLCTRTILHVVNVFPDMTEYPVVSIKTDSYGRERGLFATNIICSIG